MWRLPATPERFMPHVQVTGRARGVQCSTGNRCCKPPLPCPFNKTFNSCFWWSIWCLWILLDLKEAQKKFSNFFDPPRPRKKNTSNPQKGGGVTSHLGGFTRGLPVYFWIPWGMNRFARTRFKMKYSWSMPSITPIEASQKAFSGLTTPTSFYMHFSEVAREFWQNQGGLPVCKFTGNLRWAVPNWFRAYMAQSMWKFMWKYVIWPNTGF